MDVFKILEPGAFTTVQDAGRFGYQQFGVPVSGVVDQFSYQVANMLVGNPNDAALIEITVLGPKIEVLDETDIAYTGGTFIATLNGNPMEGWRSYHVFPEDLLVFRQVKEGCRAYLSVRGGIDVPVVMGSRSTYIGAKIGGLNGRPLAKGDTIRRIRIESMKRPRVLPEALRPKFVKEMVLRAVPGPQDDYFDEGAHVFFDEEFKVSTKADRMGYRLEGPVIELKEGAPKSIISEPCLPGGVQIPADGQPIILLLEQTVGGYAKIATVVSSDLPFVGQAKPGDLVRFKKISLEQAHGAYRRFAKTLQDIRNSLS